MLNNTLSANGYDLYEAFEAQWVLDFKNGDAFYGSLEEIGVYMCKKLDFNLREIDIAVEEMIKKNHNAAHFGVFKSMIFTFVKEINLDRKVS
jgi:hypothetical protein